MSPLHARIHIHRPHQLVPHPFQPRDEVNSEHTRMHALLPAREPRLTTELDLVIPALVFPGLHAERPRRRYLEEDCLRCLSRRVDQADLVVFCRQPRREAGLTVEGDGEEGAYGVRAGAEEEGVVAQWLLSASEGRVGLTRLHRSTLAARCHPIPSSATRMHIMSRRDGTASRPLPLPAVSVACGKCKCQRNWGRNCAGFVWWIRSGKA